MSNDRSAPEPLPARKAAFPRGRRLIAFVGGLLFMLVVMLFLAKIQPVGKDKDAISVARSFKISTPRREASIVKPPPKRQKEPPKQRQKEPPKKRERRPAPKKSVSEIRKPSRSTAPPSAPTGVSLNVMPGGLGGGAVVSASVGTELPQEFQNAQEQMLRDEEARQLMREEAARFESRGRDRPGGQARGARCVYTPDTRDYYPQAAAKEGLEGNVRVSAFVTEDGSCTNPKVLGSDYVIFEEPALAIAKLTTWESARDDKGRAIGEWVEFKLVFKLK